MVATLVARTCSGPHRVARIIAGPVFAVFEMMATALVTGPPLSSCPCA
jgi:hypothetical protein